MPRKEWSEAEEEEEEEGGGESSDTGIPGTTTIMKYLLRTTPDILRDEREDVSCYVVMVYGREAWRY